MTSGFFLSTRTVVLHKNNVFSKFFIGVGGRAKKFTLFVTFVRQETFSGSESVELTICLLLIGNRLRVSMGPLEPSNLAIRGWADFL